MSIIAGDNIEEIPPVNIANLGPRFFDFKNGLIRVGDCTFSPPDCVAVCLSQSGPWPSEEGRIYHKECDGSIRFIWTPDDTNGPDLMLVEFLAEHFCVVIYGKPDIWAFHCSSFAAISDRDLHLSGGINVKNLAGRDRVPTAIESCTRCDHHIKKRRIAIKKANDN